MTNRRRSSLWSAQKDVIDLLKRVTSIYIVFCCASDCGIGPPEVLLWLWAWLWLKFGHTVVIPLRQFAVTHNKHFDLCYSEHGFALFSNDILTFLHRNNSPPEISLWKCDPHAGWESHFSKQSKKVKHAWAAQMPKDVKSFGNVQETNFSGILAAEVLNKSKLALPRSTGIKNNNASHRAWGSHFWFLQHP